MLEKNYKNTVNISKPGNVIYLKFCICLKTAIKNVLSTFVYFVKHYQGRVKYNLSDFKRVLILPYNIIGRSLQRIFDKIKLSKPFIFNF